MDSLRHSPPACGCITGQRLCLRAERLRGRLEAERQLAERTQDWRFYHETMRAAADHVTALSLAIR